ncbi:astacin-like metalloendopeptidase [Bombina bombina]|uniref:astacin-like metalloendopeptidase n=1 Tax=Bombina bombina TaxID=8345 RepID=UPI00235A6968|nr:astacin-like metalloendopeptidase [Bombina bombina]
MDSRICVTFIYYLLRTSRLFSLQASATTISLTEASEIPEEEDVYSIITKQNKGSKKLIDQGDIAVLLRRSAMGCQDGSCFWPKSKTGMVLVPYILSTDYTAAETEVIFSAMLEYTTLTCIHFVQRQAEIDYIHIRSIDGCWSYLGKVGGPQDVSLLKTGCVSNGIVQHELNHVLGFVHEHTRSDRDSYVDIDWAHISKAFVSNFEKAEPETNNMALKYDYTSVMHYGRFAFTNTPGQATIIPKPDTTVIIGQRYGLSNLDLMKIKQLYQCDTCSTLLTESSGSLSSGYNDVASANKSVCVWLIRTSAEKVFLNFHTFAAPTTCHSEYIAVYDGATRMSPLLLYRACGTGALPPLVSSANRMLLEFVSEGASSFSASYYSGKCGGTLTAMNGTLTSPGYPRGYQPSTDCTWSIVAPNDYWLSLKITYFSLESSRNCIYDYLSLLDGSRTGSSPDKYCGIRTLPTFITSGSWLVLQFHSDRSVQNIGFQAKYSWVTKQV